MKWYEDLNINQNIIISSRVRLARNIEGYKFNNFIDKQVGNDILNVVKNAVFKIDNENNFDFIDFESLTDIERLIMVENHSVSLDFAKKAFPRGLVLQKDERASIMINEEDHIRIQSVFEGDNIESAFEKANKIDDLMEEMLEYAFDRKYGYLTSCITNMGTGLRASFMVHIPFLEKYKQINDISKNISKFGITIRGIYGEGSKPLGSIYQISNQGTLGKTEKDIIKLLENVKNQIVEKEKYLRTYLKNEYNSDFVDKIYRSYGILKYCKKISNNEAMNHLSNLWIGIYLGILKDDELLKCNMYNIMMMMQPANLTKIYKDIQDIKQIDVYRADYINNLLSTI